MSVAFYQGQALTSSDLKIITRDVSGVPIDPYYIRYSLFDYTTGIDVLIGDPNRIPATTGVGQYYVDAVIPFDANIGDWIVRWNFNETPTSPLVEVAQDFNIVSADVKTSIAQTTAQDVLLRRLRILLRDNNPDRNYRFRPPSTEKFMQTRTQVFGYIWEDEELYEYLLFAVDELNSSPPVTGVTLDNLPDRWRSNILMRAAAAACGAVTLNWIADEFSVDGSERVTVKDESGVEYSLSLEELFNVLYGDKLNAIHEEVKREYNEALKELSNEAD